MRILTWSRLAFSMRDMGVPLLSGSLATASESPFERSFCKYFCWLSRQYLPSNRRRTLSCFWMIGRLLGDMERPFGTYQ